MLLYIVYKFGKNDYEVGEVVVVVHHSFYGWKRIRKERGIILKKNKP